MRFSEILGHESQKEALMAGVALGRIPHAQLFVGPEGCGLLPMALAYAQYVFCQNQTSENSDEGAGCNLRCDQLSHPDLHFVYPTAANDRVKSKPSSTAFLDDWRSFVLENPYGSLFDWYQHLGVENKQGQIGVADAQELISALGLKSYEGGWKGVVVWGADKLNIAAANKLLKLVEEPPEKTLLLLVTNHEDQVLETLRSRCQTTAFSSLPPQTIASGLLSKGCPQETAQQLAHQANGDYNLALSLLKNTDTPFEDWFVHWVRTAFKARSNKSAVLELMAWSQQVAGTGRETQKQFLRYCIELFRQALMTNYGLRELTHFVSKGSFELDRFAPFVHNGNIFLIVKALEDSFYHVERNGNAKMIFSELSLTLTKLIHAKPQAA